MERQLTLLRVKRNRVERNDWRLDERTKEIGRRGLADARQALAEAKRRAAA